MLNQQGPTPMPQTVSSFIHTFTIIIRDFIHNTTQRFHLDREVFTITSQECKPASVSLAVVSLSGQYHNRTRNSMKIQSTSNNLIRSKLCTQFIFSQDDKVERWKDDEILHRFLFFDSHTTNVESETVERSSRGGEGRRLGFLFFVTINVARYWNRPFTRCRCGQ